MYTYLYIYMCIHMYAYALPPFLCHTPHICRTSSSSHVLRCHGAIFLLLLHDERTQGSREQLALQLLFDATNGDSWSSNTGWKTASDLNSWFGVTATSSTVVTAVDLNSNNLAGGCVCFHASATMSCPFTLTELTD
jgi:hypothetical protein